LLIVLNAVFVPLTAETVWTSVYILLFCFGFYRLASSVVSTRDDSLQAFEKAVQLNPNSERWYARAVARALKAFEEIVAHDGGRQFRIQPDNS